MNSGPQTRGIVLQVLPQLMKHFLHWAASLAFYLMDSPWMKIGNKWSHFIRSFSHLISGINQSKDLLIQILYFQVGNLNVCLTQMVVQSLSHVQLFTTLWTVEHARLPCPSLSPGVCSNYIDMIRNSVLFGWWKNMCLTETFTFLTKAC